MTLVRWTLAVAVTILVGLAMCPAPGWAVGCCKCTACPPPRDAVFCTTGANNEGDCFETCEGCADPLMFDPAATCGVGAFAACVGAPAPVAPAPALGSRGLAIAAVLLVGAGFLRLARRTTRRP